MFFIASLYERLVELFPKLTCSWPLWRHLRIDGNRVWTLWGGADEIHKSIRMLFGSR